MLKTKRSEMVFLKLFINTLKKSAIGSETQTSANRYKICLQIFPSYLHFFAEKKQSIETASFISLRGVVGGQTNLPTGACTQGSNDSGVYWFSPS